MGVPVFGMKQRPSIASIIFLAFLLPACQPAGAPPSATSPTVVFTATPSTKPSPTATETVTATITPTPTLTVTPTLIPTVTPTPIAMPHLRVAYGGIDGLWIVEPPAPPVKVSEKLFPDNLLFSEDGSRLTYFTYAIAGSYIPIFGFLSVNDNGNFTLLPSINVEKAEKEWDSTAAMIPKWIPGTHSLLVSVMAFDTAVSSGLWIPYMHLYKLNVDSGFLSRVPTTGTGGIATPSPDGNRLTISNCDMISLASIYGQILFSDIIPLEPSYWPACLVRNIVWSKDSSRFGAIAPSDTGSATIWSVDSSTGAALNLGIIDPFGQGVLSPTLDYVGHYRWGDKKIASDATVTRVDGTSGIRLYSGPSYFLSFAPDGLHFVYYVGCGSDSHCTVPSSDEGIYIGSHDGSYLRVHGGGIKWINNSQFVYIFEKSLRLGDIGGNSIEIATAEYFHTFDAKDLDFQSSLN
jgi:hypothetical protein